MILFLLIYFTFYGSMHAYAFFKARAALQFGKSAGELLAVFMSIMMLAPIIIRAPVDQPFENARSLFIDQDI